ncbi:MAG TPA: DUF4214 domain-containing protein [Acidobacteriota bacterium]|jgi:hypothetical protein
MKKNVLLLIALWVFFGPSTWASTFKLLSQDELVASADAIVGGRIAALESIREGESPVQTLISLEVKYDFSNQITPGTVIYLKQLGGKFQDVVTWEFGAPEFEVGEEVIAFLNLRPDGLFEVSHLYQGKFRILPSGDLKRSTPESAEVVERDVEEFKTFDDVERVVNRKGLRPLRPFARHVKPIVSEPLSRFSFSALSSTDTTTAAATATLPRWNQFDSGVPVNFYVNLNAAPLNSSSTVNVVNTVVNAWNSVPGTRIILKNGGTTTASGYNFNDGVNAITFNDPQQIIPDPVGGGGTLAITYVTFSTTSTIVVNGVTYSKLLQADIVFNNGWNSFFSVTSNLSEVMAHEMGHGLGLAHSSDVSQPAGSYLQDALMYYLAHADGRGASIRAYDIAAVQAVYPGPTNPGGITNERLVAQFYRDFLGREGTANEIQTWANAISAATLTRAQVGLQFFQSAEFQQSYGAVARDYLGLFGRRPDYAGLVAWRDYLVAQGRTEAARQAIVDAFIQSPEFAIRFGTNLTAEQFVTLLYQNILGRTPSQSELQSWANVIKSGQATRGQVARQFVESQEFINRSYFDVFVILEYVGFLRRVPEDSGFWAWRNALASGSLTETDLIQGFLDSTEYKNRLAAAP